MNDNYGWEVPALAVHRYDEGKPVKRFGPYVRIMLLLNILQSGRTCNNRDGLEFRFSCCLLLVILYSLKGPKKQGVLLLAVLS